MRKLDRRTAFLLVPVALLFFVVTAEAGSAGPPVLTEYDVEHAGLTNLADVTDNPSGRAVASGITVAEAIRIAREFGGIPDVPARVVRAEGAQFAEEAARPVYVVIVAGGTFPFDGPMDGPVSGKVRTARLTGILINATTGEFLRGFMHK